MGLWYQDVFRGFGLAATGVVSGAAAGGPLGGLLGGIYGSVKAGTGGASEGGSSYLRNVGQTALPSAAAGLLLYPSSQAAYKVAGKTVAAGDGSWTNDQSLIGAQLTALKGEVAGLGSGLAGGTKAGAVAVGGATSDIFSGLLGGTGKLLSSLGAGVGTLLSGQAPNALAALYGNAREAAGGISAPSLTSILGGAATPTGSGAGIIPVPIPANNNSDAPVLAGFPQWAMLLIAGAVVYFLIFKRGRA